MSKWQRSKCTCPCDCCHKAFDEEHDDIVECRQGFCSEDSEGKSRMHRSCLVDENPSEYCSVCNQYRCGHCPDLAQNGCDDAKDTDYSYAKCTICETYACQASYGDEDGGKCFDKCDKCPKRIVICKNCRPSNALHEVMGPSRQAGDWPGPMQHRARFRVYRCHDCLPLRLGVDFAAANRKHCWPSRPV